MADSIRADILKQIVERLTKYDHNRKEAQEFAARIEKEAFEATKKKFPYHVGDPQFKKKYCEAASILLKRDRPILLKRVAPQMNMYQKIVTDIIPMCRQMRLVEMTKNWEKVVVRFKSIHAQKVDTQTKQRQFTELVPHIKRLYAEYSARVKAAKARAVTQASGLDGFLLSVPKADTRSLVATGQKVAQLLENHRCHPRVLHLQLLKKRQQAAAAKQQQQQQQQHKAVQQQQQQGVVPQPAQAKPPQVQAAQAQALHKQRMGNLAALSRAQLAPGMGQQAPLNMANINALTQMPILNPSAKNAALIQQAQAAAAQAAAQAAAALARKQAAQQARAKAAAAEKARQQKAYMLQVQLQQKKLLMQQQQQQQQQQVAAAAAAAAAQASRQQQQQTQQQATQPVMMNLRQEVENLKTIVPSATFQILNTAHVPAPMRIIGKMTLAKVHPHVLVQIPRDYDLNRSSSIIFTLEKGESPFQKDRHLPTITKKVTDTIRKRSGGPIRLLMLARCLHEVIMAAIEAQRKKNAQKLAARAAQAKAQQ